MAVRIRTDGRIFCAAHRPEEPGDIYVDDAVHYHLSCVAKVLVSEEIGRHLINPQWWWRHAIPDGVEMAPQYRNDFQPILRTPRIDRHQPEPKIRKLGS